MILITDPNGVLHVLGDITEDHDFSECGQEFATTKGWRGSAHGAKAICVECLSRATSSTIKHNFITPGKTQ